MLNMNRYSRITNLFEHGFSLELFKTAINRYAGGQIRVMLNFFEVYSSGTGHVPFTMFDLSFVTGPMWAAQITLLGLVFGTRLEPVVDENNCVAGPDRRSWYVNISMLNQPLNNKEIN